MKQQEFFPMFVVASAAAAIMLTLLEPDGWLLALPIIAALVVVGNLKHRLGI